MNERHSYCVPSIYESLKGGALDMVLLGALAGACAALRATLVGPDLLFSIPEHGVQA